MLASVQGPESGRWITATPAETGTQMQDDEFVIAMRLRLGLAVNTKAKCGRASASGHKTCNDPMDPLGEHALTCKLAGLGTRMHDACCLRLWQAAKETGAGVLREQVIPAIQSPTRREPRIDVEVWGLPGLAHSLYDFTICVPSAARYTQDAAAPQTAEARKRREYPKAAGLAVEGLAMNTFGIMGPALREVLEQWADRARLQDVSRGRMPRRWVHLWTTQLTSAVAIGAARMVIASERASHQATGTPADTTPTSCPRPKCTDSPPVQSVERVTGAPAAVTDCTHTAGDAQ